MDRWPEPRTVLAGTGGNYTLLGDPRALRPADLQPHVRGYLNTTEALVPLLVSAFPDAKPWARVILARHASSKSIAIGEHDVRRLGPRDAHYVAQLGADSAWISMTWGGPSGLASSGYAWGAFAAGRLVSVACTFFLGQTLEDIGVVTEPDFRGQGLSVACASALCRDILARGRLPSWTTSIENAASLRVAQKLGFEQHRMDTLYAVGVPIPRPNQTDRSE